MKSIRVGIVGARRDRQGIGQYVAQQFALGGAQVAAIVGTSARSVEEARTALRADYDVDVAGFQTMGEMLAEQELDAVAICSPQQFHADHLATALEHNVHVLCEKPFIFAPDAEEALRQTDMLVEGFAAKGCVLMVNEQWPFTLPVFDQCFPKVRQNQSLEKLEVLLSPGCEGIDMIPNAVPHIISLLLAHVPPGGHLENVRITNPRPNWMKLGFQYVHHKDRVDVQGLLISCDHPPRPAAYAINGCAIRRTIELPAYDFFFDILESGLIEDALHASPLEIGSRAHPSKIAMEDPLRLLITEFIRRVEDAPRHTPIDPIIKDSVRLLHQLFCEAVRISDAA